MILEIDLNKLKIGIIALIIMIVFSVAVDILLRQDWKNVPKWKLFIHDMKERIMGLISGLLFLYLFFDLKI